MKRFIAVVAVLVVVVGATSVMASVQVGDKIRFYDREGSPGGEYGAAMAGTPNNPELFRTFCLERNEYLDFSSAGFNVVSINDYAVKGGQGGQVTANRDILSSATKYLFWKFWTGTLSNYDYTPGSAEHITDANALQNVIWRLEGESYSTADPESTAWYNEATGSIGSGAWNTSVKVLNITWASTRSGYGIGTDAQSVLCVIPEPATLIIWSLLGAGSWLGMRIYRQGQGGRRSWSKENRAAILKIIERD